VGRGKVIGAAFGKLLAGAGQFVGRFAVGGQGRGVTALAKVY